MILIDECCVHNMFSEFTTDLFRVLEVRTDNCHVSASLQWTGVRSELKYVRRGIEVEENSVVSPFLPIECDL